MSIQSVWQMSFGFFDEKPIVVEASDASLTSDAGLLPIRQLDEGIGLTEQFATALRDPRREASVSHPFLEMVRTRVYGILADYPDQNDHDAYFPHIGRSIFRQFIGGRSAAVGVRRNAKELEYLTLERG
jgi:hypothetical protein